MKDRLEKKLQYLPKEQQKRVIDLINRAEKILNGKNYTPEQINNFFKYMEIANLDGKTYISDENLLVFAKAHKDGNLYT